MIISHKYKFCFVHIPKNGGSSISKMLQKYHDHDQIMTGVKLIGQPPEKKDLAHMNTREFAKYFNANECLTYFNFGFIRDPIQRFKSAYIEYLQHVRRNYNEKPLLLNDLLNIFSYNDGWVHDDRFIHFRPQTHYTHDENDVQILKIFHLNSIEKCIESIANILGIDIFYTNVRTNTGKSNTFENLITLSETDISRIKSIYHRDYKLLSF